MSQECGTSHQAVKSFANSQLSAKIHPDPPQHTTGVWKVKDSTLAGDADVFASFMHITNCLLLPNL